MGPGSRPTSPDRLTGHLPVRKGGRSEREFGVFRQVMKYGAERDATPHNNIDMARDIITKKTAHHKDSALIKMSAPGAVLLGPVEAGDSPVENCRKTFYPPPA